MAHTWVNTPVLSKIKTSNNTEYYVKDSEARSAIENLETQISGGVHSVGVTTTALTDGSTTNPIQIGGSSYTAVNGDLVSYDGKEFLWTTSITPACWQELGSTGSLKAFAYADQGTATITPSVSVPEMTCTATGGSTDVVLGEATTFTNASSSVSFSGGTTDTFVKTAKLAEAESTDEDKISYISGITTSGTQAVTFGTSGNTASAITAMGASTVPKVSVSATTKKLATTSVTPVGSVGTAASWTSSVTNEVLSFSFTANTPTSAGTAVTVGTGKLATTDANGDSVAYDVSNSTSGTLSVTFGTPTTATVLKSSVTATVPKVVAGSTQYAKVTTTTGSAVTGVGTATAAAQTITVGTNDKVTAYKTLPTYKTPVTTATGSATAFDVNPKSST